MLSPQTWRLGDLGAKHALLKQGLGWGNMPHDMVADDLEAGRLVALDLPEKSGDMYTLSALWRRDARWGPAGSWPVDEYRARLAR